MVEATKCSGCGSCAAICPQNCIVMQADAEGFRYPVIDSAKCVHCGACERGCPAVDPVPINAEPSALAAQNVDDAVRFSSSSGGVFSALAEDVLARNGRVCGAVYHSDFSVCHVIIDSAERLGEMRGAKYAQSRAEQCFPEIRALLREGVPVLFVGTPCQTAGLRAYLGREYPGLLLVDMICHGVPSPMVWKQYLRERSQEIAPGGELCGVNLRSKTSGWSRYGYSVEMKYTNGASSSVPQGQDLFMRGFVSNLYLRPSCAACSFKGVKRFGDLTLGDYWGIWDQYPEFDDNKGTSLLLIYTEKGCGAWNRVAGRFRSLHVTVQDAVAQNPSAVQASVPHPNRDRFFRGMEEGKPILQWIGQCLEPRNDNLMQRLIRKLSRR